MALTISTGGRVAGPVPSMHPDALFPNEAVAISLNRFMRDATAPALLLGMGLGHLGWGAGRLLGTKGALALGGSLRLSLWTGRAAGVMAEAGAWTALASGRPGAPWGLQWGGTGVTVASLRAVGGMLGGRSPVILALGTYGALAGSQALVETTLGNPRRTLSQIMEDSLELMLGLQIAGILSRGLYGSKLAQLDRAFQSQISPQALAKIIRGEWNGIRMIAPEGPLGGDRVFAMGEEPPRRPFRPRAISSPTPSVRRVVRKTGEIHAPWRVKDLNGWKARLADPTAEFLKQIREDHIHFLLPEGRDFPVLEAVEFLGSLSYLADLPGGRKIQIQFEDPSPPVEFIKWGDSFRVRPGGANTPPGGTFRPKTPVPATFASTQQDLAGIREMMANLVHRPPSHPTMPQVRPGRNVGTPAETPFAKRLSDLRMVSDIRVAKRVVDEILEPTKGVVSEELFWNRPEGLTSVELGELAQAFRASPKGSELKLHDPDRRRTFNWVQEGPQLRWGSDFWEAPANSTRLQARSLIEVLQKLSFFRDPARPENEALAIDFYGRWRPWQDGGELETFLNVQIPRPFRPIHIYQGSRRQGFQFDPKRRTWFKGPLE